MLGWLDLSSDLVVFLVLLCSCCNPVTNQELLAVGDWRKEEKLLEWESHLIQIQEITDDWLKVQARWLYLEPSFSSENVMEQMPEEGPLFQAVARVWRSGEVVNSSRRYYAEELSRMVIPQNTADTAPEDGVYIHGLFLGGARWDRTKSVTKYIKCSFVSFLLAFLKAAVLQKAGLLRAIVLLHL